LSNPQLARGELFTASGRMRRPAGRRAAWWSAALFISVTPAGAAESPGAGASDLERAKKIVAGSCFLCHGPDGDSSSDLYPKLAAQNAEYIAKQLANFRSGARKSTAMAGMVKDLSPADMRALGAYFGGKPPSPGEVRNAALAPAGRALYQEGNPATGVEPCVTCHGAGAAGSALLPRLAGQDAGYLETQLRQFNKRERTNDNAVMHGIAVRLTEREMQAVAEYLAAMK
jgi:cytochrome c553